MNNTTLKALKKSIEHWERMVSGNRKANESIGVKHCALCKLFWFGGVDCNGCPVSERTGRSTCELTPYEYAAGAFEVYGPDSKQFKVEARKELKFLKSLLPKTNKKGKP